MIIGQNVQAFAFPHPFDSLVMVSVTIKSNFVINQSDENNSIENKLTKQNWSHDKKQFRFLFEGNAEVTELYKCSKLRTVCCASKSHLHEILGHHHQHDSVSPTPPYRVTTGHTPIEQTSVTHKIIKPTKSSIGGFHLH